MLFRRGDVEGNGTITIGDPIVLLDYQFASGPAPAPPGPTDCGEDPTSDSRPAETCAYPQESCR